MGRIFTVSASFTFTNAGGDADLLELLPGDDKPITLRKIKISNQSDYGDAAAEGIRLQVIRMTATVTTGSGGATPNIEAVKSRDSAVSPGFTAEVNNTTRATTSGATDVIEELGWNIQNSPYEIVWEERELAPDAKQTEGLFLYAPAAPTDDLVIQITAYVEEEG